jgi:hypothetical protein
MERRPNRRQKLLSYCSCTMTLAQFAEYGTIFVFLRRVRLWSYAGIWVMA